MEGGGAIDDDTTTDSAKKRKPKKERKVKKSKKKKRKHQTSSRDKKQRATDQSDGELHDQSQTEVDGIKPEGLSVLPPATLATSWGDIFASANSVTPIPLGDDFRDGESEIGYGGGNIAMVSQIAKDYLEASAASSLRDTEDGDEKLRKNDGLRPEGKDDEECEVDTERDVEADAEDKASSQTSKKKRKKERKKERKKNKVTPPSSDKMSATVSATDDALESGDTNDPSILQFPYTTDPDDHCESPAVAYQDILPILKKLTTTNNLKDSFNLRIYDPYYCNGSVISNLAQIGFPNVYNQKEDCYKTWSQSDATQPYPAHDVLVTNPPYSEDHIQRLVHHVTSTTGGRTGTEAWCLLMPNFVHKKDYFAAIVQKGKCEPFYLVPKKRYVYIPPKDFREKKESDVHKKSSPFVSMWYVWGGTIKKNAELMDAYRAEGARCSCSLARSKSALRDLRRKK